MVFFLLENDKIKIRRGIVILIRYSGDDRVMKRDVSDVSLVLLDVFSGLFIVVTFILRSNLLKCSINFSG